MMNAPLLLLIDMNVLVAVIILQSNITIASALHRDSSGEGAEVNTTHLSACQKDVL